jgi:hypothetical protein
MVALVLVKSWQPQHGVKQILAGMNVTGSHDIFEHAHTWKQPDVLKCA